MRRRRCSRATGELRAFSIPYRWRLVVILLTGVAATSFGLIQPYTSKLLIDEALLPRDFRKLVLVSLMMVGATVISFALNILSSYQYVRVSAVVLFDMRVALYRHLQLLSPRFWVRSKLGDVVSRINNDISEVQRISADSLLSVLSNVVFLIGSAVIMASLNLKLFLLSLIVLPFSLWSLRYYQSRLVARVKAVRERGADIGSFLIETLLGIRVVVTAGAEVREVERFRSRNQSFLDALLSMQMTSFLSGAVPGTLITLSTAALFLYGGKLVIDGDSDHRVLGGGDGVSRPFAQSHSESDEPLQQPGLGRCLADAGVRTIRHNAGGGRAIPHPRYGAGRRRDRMPRRVVLL